MQLHVHSTRQQSATAAAELLQETLVENSTIGVATGRTPLALYQALAGHKLPRLAGGFALDEYVGLAWADPNSFAYYVRTHIEPALSLAHGSIRVPNGAAEDPNSEAAHFEAAILKTPIFLQILGVGSNGHIAFNEPGSARTSVTRVVELSDQTRADNAESFEGEVPRFAITQGIGTILRAKHLVLLAHGEAKAEAIRRLSSGESDSYWPITHLFEHPSLHVFVDEAAASQL